MNAMTPMQHSVKDVWQMAVALAKSGLFGVKDETQAYALMLVAQAEGKHPAIVAREYDIIQGKAALKADAMLARFQAAGGTVKWLQYTDEVVSAEFSHPSGGTVKIDWDTARANRAGLTGKQTWKQYPRAMRRARCISEGVHTVFPGCAIGTYTVEEVGDFTDTPEAIKQADATVVEQPKNEQDFKQPVTRDSEEWKNMGEGFDRPARAIEPPTEPEAAALDAKINGPVIDPEHEVPTAFKPKRKMVKLRDLDREHAERALKLAEWQIAKTDEFGKAWKEGTANKPILEALLATMPAPAAKADPKPDAAPNATEQQASEPPVAASGPTYDEQLRILLAEAGYDGPMSRKRMAEQHEIDDSHLVEAMTGKRRLSDDELAKLEAAGVNVAGLKG